MSDNFLEPADDEQVVVATPEEQLPGLVGYIKEKFDDYLTFVIIGIIVGGRLGYIFFYNLDYYFNNLSCSNS